MKKWMTSALYLLCFPTVFFAQPLQFNQPRHQFVVAPDVETTTKVSGSLNQSEWGAKLKQTQNLQMADAVVFFEQAVFLTYFLSPSQLATHQLAISHCYNSSSWQELQLSGYKNLLGQIIKNDYSTSIVPLLPPVMDIIPAQSFDDFRINISMPVLLRVVDPKDHGHLEKFLIQAIVQWVGKNKGLRGWQIQTWSVSKSKITQLG